MSRPARVLWGMTAYGPFPYAPVYTSHMRAIAWASRVLSVEFNDGSSIRGAGSTDRMYTHAAENAIARELLDSDATHLFMTEMDMVLPKHTIPALLELDVLIASGVYFLRNGGGQPCLYKRSVSINEESYGQNPIRLFPRTRPFKVGCPGLGCVLIHREVFERVPFPWFDLAEGKYGSDMYFYRECEKAGIDVWAHPGVMCDQMDYNVVGYADYEKRLATDKSWAAQGFIVGAE